MNIGFFGGTFSPPHLGHLHSAKAFAEECALDKLIIIPAKVSPFKVKSEKTADDSHRFEMSKLCFKNLESFGVNVELSDFEITKKETSYTYITIRHLLSRFPLCKLFMYVGFDMFLSLEKWKNADEIFEKCCIYTRARDKNELELLYDCKEKYKELYNAHIIVSNESPFCVSSTQIRELLLKNDTKTLKNLLTDDVFGYIMENRLYFGEQ